MSMSFVCLILFLNFFLSKILFTFTFILLKNSHNQTEKFYTCEILARVLTSILIGIGPFPTIEP